MAKLRLEKQGDEHILLTAFVAIVSLVAVVVLVMIGTA